MRRVLAVLALLLAASTPVRAAQAKPSLDVRVVRGWFGGQSPLELDAQVSNVRGQAVDNLRITVAIYERARSRGDLEDAFEGDLPRTPLAAFTTSLPPLPAGGSQRVRLTRSAADLGAIERREDGLYPVALSLRGPTGPVIASVVTAAAFISETPRLPLRVAPVQVIAPAPLRRADGRPDKRAAQRLATLERELGDTAGAPGGVAVSGLLAEDLRALRTSGGLRDEAAAVETALRERTSRSTVLGLPYAYGELGQAIDLAGPSAARDQLDRGRAAITEILGVGAPAIAYLPGLDAGGRALSAVSAAGYRTAVVAGSHLTSIARGLTPAENGTFDGVLLLPADRDMARRMSDARTDLDRSRIVAMTAMVYFESPARPRTIVLPGDSAAPFADVTSVLSQAPWIKLVGPRDVASSPGREVRSSSLTAPAKAPANVRRELAQARKAVGELASITLDGNAVVGGLRGALDAAVGSLWFDDGGVAWARDISHAAALQRRRIATVGSGPVTFTSREGTVPVTIVNRTDYPIRVRVEIHSPKLQFPRGASRTFAALEPPGETVTFRATTKATGTFPLQVRLVSADGSIVVDEARFVVRSTAYNIGAVLLFVTTGLFLTVSFGRRLLARRKRGTAA